MSQLYRFLEPSESFAEGDVVVRTAPTAGPQVAYPPTALRPVNGYVVDLDGIMPYENRQSPIFGDQIVDDDGVWHDVGDAEHRALRFLAAVAKVRAS